MSTPHRLLLPTLIFSLAVSAFPISFDPAFASAGKFITTFSEVGAPTSSGSAVFLQPNGRIVVVGSHRQDGPDGGRSGIVMAGLTPSGVLDTTFGTNGKVFNWSPETDRAMADSAMLPDGSIVVLTFFQALPATLKPSIVKYTPDGQLDLGFNPNLVHGEGQPLPVLVAPGASGKIYAAIRTGAQFFLIRLNADGSRDATFGQGGVRPLNLNRFPQPTVVNLVELDGGKLLLLGHTYVPAAFTTGSFIVRFDSDGNLDRSFGVQGVVRPEGPRGDAQVQAQRLLIQPDGKVLIGGYYTFLGSYAILIRLTARGRPDATFGTAGVALSSFNNWNGILGIAMAPDGKIVVAGHCGAKAIPPNERLFVARFSAGGVLESSLVTNFISTRDAAALDVKVQPDGKFVIAAFTVSETTTARQLASARFIP